MTKNNRKKDIAVIGMSGVFPKSNELAVFWDHLINGKELVHFYDKTKVDPKLLAIPNFVAARSFIDHPESFDYKFFGYTKAEAALMDPQIRVMHEQVYSALDNAGYVHQLEKDSIGLYLSASDNINWRLLEMFYYNGKVSKFLAQRLSNKEFISTLISYKLGLKGPSFFIDTACSGSLSNIHLACRSLLLRECNIAVSGGVSIHSTEDKGYFFEEGLIASQDGHCKAFDAKSDGTVWGEGAGAVVLKRFEDAVRDNDHIYAVIKATAVNNDGKRKVGYTAPSVEGQAECIKMAHKIAGLTPESISYIEAHGTGTKLGDPIEIEALNKAFNYNTNHQCAIGSVKTNMGHLDAAAGIAGFIKTCLCLNFKVIPPSLHFETPNPGIKFDRGPFYVNTSLKKWEGEGTFRAGVSSFGIGGTNCHAVLEAYDEAPVETSQNPYDILLFSSKTKTALQNYKTRLSSFFKREQINNRKELSYSFNQKVQAFPFQDFIVFENEKDALNQLASAPSTGLSKKYKNIVFLFPGQGTQYFAMAQELYASLPAFQTIMDQGFGLLKEFTGLDYQTILGYETTKEEADESVNNTLHTQPLLFLVEYALAKTLMNFGVQPNAMIGHSLGEYVAACVSNVFSLEDGLNMICKRAALMNSMKEGVMVAVKAAPEEVIDLLENKWSVATLNTPNTCVLAGELESVEALSATLKEHKITHSVLNTSHAFHSYMMDDMLEPFRKEVAQFNFSKPEIPFISNLTGKLVTTDDLSADYWAKHLRNTVLFQKGLEGLVQEWPVDESIFIEVGPGRTLLNFLKRVTGKKAFGLSILKGAKEQKHDFKYFLTNLGNLWKAGVTINWDQLYDPNTQKMPVPSYVFDKTELPSRVNPLKLFQDNIKEGTDMTSMLLNISTGSLFDDQGEDTNNTLEDASQDERVHLTTDYQAPQNDTQTQLCTIWKSFLGYEKIGINDDFFELGGDSLKAISILNTIKKTFNCDIKVQELYDCPTIKKVSAKIELTNKLKNVSRKISPKNKLTI